MYMFDEPTALTNIVKQTTFSFSNQLNIIFNTVKFIDDQGILRFKEVIRNASRAYDDSLALLVFNDVLATKKITQQIELPFDVTASNAPTQTGNTLTWVTNMYDVLYNQIEMTADMTKPEGLTLTYADKIDKTIGKVSAKDNPLIRVQVYNGNKEPVKIGTGIVLKDNLLVTNFHLMDLIGGGGFFSVILNNDSLAGIDEMTEKDIDQDDDLVFLRFTNNEKARYFKIATMESVIYGSKVKIYYYPNALSSVVYSMDGSVTGIKKWTKNTSCIEIKPAKPLSIEGGAVFNENGEFVGIITQAFNGEVGKLYLVPGVYIRGRIP